jgi:hypothetical protein
MVLTCTHCLSFFVPFSLQEAMFCRKSPSSNLVSISADVDSSEAAVVFDEPLKVLHPHLFHASGSGSFTSVDLVPAVLICLGIVLSRDRIGTYFKVSF